MITDLFFEHSVNHVNFPIIDFMPIDLSKSSAYEDILWNSNITKGLSPNFYGKSAMIIS